MIFGTMLKKIGQEEPMLILVLVSANYGPALLLNTDSRFSSIIS